MIDLREYDQEKIKVSRVDNGEGDAFGRLRVSEVNSQLDLKQLHDPLPLFYDTYTNAQSASITHSEIEARSQITTTATSDIAIIQSKQRANYSSGKSQQIFMTFNNFDVETNITKRVGYFTHLSSSAGYDTSLDGLWLESTADGISINVYKTGVQSERTLQSDWNLDPLDGTGESGLTWDWDGNTIFILDFEWLGIGRVRWGVVHDGAIIYFHESNFSQDANGVYMSSPNQPLRAEVRQSGVGSGTFNFICSTVGSEGAINKLGKILSANLGTTHVNANSTGSKYALIGLRLQSARADTLVDLLDFSVLATTQDDQLVEVWLNPSVNGTFTYSSVTNSSMQVATGASNGSNTVTGGTLLFSTYVSQQTATPFNIENSIRLGMNIDYTVDEIVLTTNPLSSNSDVLGAISWRELS